MSQQQIFAQKKIVLDSEEISYNAKQIGIGSDSLTSITTGEDNTAVGTGSGSALTTGDGNIMIGVDAGSTYTTEDNNITIGNVGTASDSGVIRIGTAATHTTCYVTGISGVTSAGAVAAVINASGQLGTVVSSKRFKEDIEDFTLDEAEKLYHLRPVKYRRIGDVTREVHRGVIAEEAMDCQEDLIVYDLEGKVSSFQYDKLHANYISLLKHHKKEINDLKAKFQAFESKMQLD